MIVNSAPSQQHGTLQSTPDYVVLDLPMLVVVQLPPDMLVELQCERLVVLVSGVIFVALNIQFVFSVLSHLSQEPDQTGYRVLDLRLYNIFVRQLAVQGIVVNHRIL